MLRPTKHTNPKLSVLHGASLILHEVRQRRIVSHDELLERLRKSLGDDFEPDFPIYLAFLYLLGKVNYAEKTDSFIYLEDSHS